MTKSDWKVGDWAVFDRGIVQITEIRDNDNCEVSTGTINTYGRLLDRLRPLTMNNKVIAETFAWYYRELYKIKGNRGFNFPDISNRFNDLALMAMDGEFESAREGVVEFVQLAKEYTPVIQGIQLFR